MEINPREKIIYSLNIGDVQNVAMEELGRELTLEEIEKVSDKIGENIDWYDSISRALLTYMENSNP